MTTRRFVPTCLAALAAIAWLTPDAPAAQTAADWPALTTRLESAAMAGDAAGVREARLACLRLLATPASADRAPLLRYTIAYAGWRLAFIPTVNAGEQASMVDDAITQLEAVTAADPRAAEALGLLAALYGAKIGRNPDLGMTLGPLSGAHLGRAVAMDPANPRLLVLKGQSQFHTPPEFGGSIRAAEATFVQALQLFEREPASKPWPNWGRFDAHAWLGQALADRRDSAGARAQYELALKIAPTSSWVRDGLLPSVRKF